jgi:hypothetical protein
MAMTPTQKALKILAVHMPYGQSVPRGTPMPSRPDAASRVYQALLEANRGTAGLSSDDFQGAADALVTLTNPKANG